MLFAQTTVFAAEDVEIIVSSDGATKEEAIANALRSAIEQTYGAFVSTNTTILNDKLVSDEIVSLSRGNIKKYKILAEKSLPSGRYFVIVNAIVNMSKLVTYVTGSTNSIEIDMNGFDAQVILEEMNKDAEEKIINDLVVQIENMNNLWDYELQLNEPSLHNNDYRISGNLLVKYNKNSIAALSLIIETLNALDLNKQKVAEVKGARYYNYAPDLYLPYKTKDERGLIRLRNDYSNKLMGVSTSPLKLFRQAIKFSIVPLDINFNGDIEKFRGWEDEVKVIRYDNGELVLKLKKKALELRFKMPKVGDVFYSIDFYKDLSREKALSIKKIEVQAL